MEEKSRIEKIGTLLFFTGVLFEVLIMMLDRCAWTNPYEGWMFRISFLIFALKVCITKYSLKEWLVIVLCGAFAFLTYSMTTRDEVVRLVVFAAAMKGIDGKKALKTVFWTTTAGMVLLAVLSLTGVLGTVYDPYSGFGFKEGTLRLCLGVGNSNTFSIMVWTLMTLGIYLYYERMKLWHYATLLGAATLTYAATLTRTSLLMTLATILFAALMKHCRRLREGMWVYLGSILMVAAGVLFSVWSASVSALHDSLPTWIVKIDRILTGRIATLCTFGQGGARLENWKLFGDPSYVHYFDMGYVRLFYWYGILPASLVLIVLCLLLWHFRKNQDYMGLVLTASFAVFTIIEAHIVSVYIARNYILFLLGMYWVEMLGKKPKEAYWWKAHTLIIRKANNER